MTLYRVHIKDEELGESKGFRFTDSYDQAFRWVNEYYGKNAGPKHIEFLEFNPTRRDVLRLLLKVACHPDNG